MNSRRIVSTLLAIVLLFTAAAFSQLGGQGANPGAAGQYGLTAWALDNQRVASQYNYYIPSTLNSGLGGTFTFPASACQNAIYKGVYGFNPFNVNATVLVSDDVSANTETVALTSITYLGSNCTLALSTANTHYSFRLRSGTCGLREALNDLNGKAGTVVVDQKFYDDGCTAATITTAATVGGTLQANQLINDISGNGAPWYSLQPSTLTALAVPTASASLTCATTAGLVCQSATTGGTWPNSAEVAGDIYVDALGGWSAASVTHTLTPSASGTNVLQFNSPAASTGAYGWLPWGGLTYNSAAYVLPVTAANCTLSTTFTAYPVCAIGSNATITAPVTTTSLIPQAGGIAAAYNPNPQSHTTFAYRPSQRPGYQIQLNYGPFTACPALTAGQSCVVGTVQLPTGFLQTLGIGGTARFSFDVTATPSTGGTATGIDVEIGDVTDFTTGTPLIICKLAGDITTSGTAAIKYHEECDWTVNAIGTTGSLMPGGFGIEQVSAQGTIGNPYVEGSTAATTADILDQDAVFFVFLQTSAAESTTPPQMQDLKIEILNN
jgi:hypothetical protein